MKKAHNPSHPLKEAFPNLLNSSMLSFLGTRCMENWSKVDSSFGISSKKLQFSGKPFESFLNLQSWSLTIFNSSMAQNQPLAKSLRWPPKELPQCLILHQEQASFQLQRTAPVFKSSLSMILSEMLSENWELGLGTWNCKAVELSKHFLDMTTAPWFLFHKSALLKVFVTINWF
mgnify:CR=1 FL=1